MKRYGQFCPVAKAAELFCERWTPLLIRDLAAGASRFSELQRGVPLMSPTLLSRRLKQLGAEGIVQRRPSENGRGATYHLTRAGLEFVPLVENLGVWGQRWARRQLAEEEIDLGLAIWSLERSVRADAFGKRLATVRLTLSDQPKSKRLWWFVNDNGRCELCLKDPGHEIEIYLECTLPDLIYIMRGDLALANALDTGRLQADGTTAARKALGAWFNLGPLTAVASEREAPDQPPLTPDGGSRSDMM